MARLIKCPRCQSQIDVTSVSGGATVRCPDCGSMVRVPTGNTGVHQKVAAPVPAAATASRGDTRVRTGGRQTDLFRKMSGVKGPGERPGRERPTTVRRQGSNAGLVIGGAIGGVALIGILIFATMNKSAGEQKSRDDRAKQNEAARKQNEENIKEQKRLDAEAAKEEADMKAAAKAGSKPLLQKSGSGYKAPDTFEGNAEKWTPKQLIEQMEGDAKPLYAEYEGLLGSGKTAEIGSNEAKWFACMIKGILSENERTSRSSLQCIIDFCNKKGVTTESGKAPVPIEYFNSAQWRGSMFQFWAEWYASNKSKLASAPVSGLPGARAFAAEDPDKANWPDLLMKARAGGGFDDPTTQEGNAFGRIQAMGPGAYPKLIEFIDHEDTGLGRAAVTILNRLTGSNSPLPNEANRAQIKAEWAAKYKK